LGVERVLELLKEQGTLPEAVGPDVYAIVPDASALPVVFKIIQTLRAQGISVQMHAGAGEGMGMGSMKSQFKKADGSGAQFALIFGGDELARGEVTLKALRDGAGAQEAVPLTDVTSRVAAKLAQGAA
jgi:histidyl-tRNA synthetase